MTHLAHRKPKDLDYHNEHNNTIRKLGDQINRRTKDGITVTSIEILHAGISPLFSAACAVSYSLHSGIEESKVLIGGEQLTNHNNEVSNLNMTMMCLVVILTF